MDGPSYPDDEIVGVCRTKEDAQYLIETKIAERVMEIQKHVHYSSDDLRKIRALRYAAEMLNDYCIEEHELLTMDAIWK